MHYQFTVLALLAETPLLGHKGPLGSDIFTFGQWGEGTLGMLRQVLESMQIRHAVACGLFLLGSVRQHQAAKHLASLRGPATTDSDSKVDANCTVMCILVIHCSRWRPCIVKGRLARTVRVLCFRRSKCPVQGVAVTC